MNQLLNQRFLVVCLALGLSMGSAQAELIVVRTGRLPGVSTSAGITRFDEAPTFDCSAAAEPGGVRLFGRDYSEHQACCRKPVHWCFARNDYLAAAVSLVESEQHRLQVSDQLDLENAAYKTQQ